MKKQIMQRTMESIPGSRNRKCKGPEAGQRLAQTRNKLRPVELE